MQVEVKNIKTGTPSLVDVPVRVQVWSRPDFQELQFECLKRSRPSIIFLCSDGGRTQEEMKKIEKSRAIVEGIDWDCVVHKIYFNENQGMYSSGLQYREYIKSKVDRCVWLEDDDLFSDSYLPFCAEMLERYKDDERVHFVCGVNKEGISDSVPYDYFFAKTGCIWGIATWFSKDVRDTKKINDNYTISCMENGDSQSKLMAKLAKGYATDPNFENHPAGSEFWLGFDTYANNRVCIVPKKNLISNIGCRDDASHSANIEVLPKKIQSLYNTKVYDLPRPYTHPLCVTTDFRYDEININSLKSTMPERALSFIKSGFHVLQNEGLKGLRVKINKKVRRTTEN